MSEVRNDAAHWNAVYAGRAPDAVSWYRAHLDTSLALLQSAGLDACSRVLDVGGGASTLVDDLLDVGVARIDVLDLAASAIEHARVRLGARSAAVGWIVADVRTFVPEPGAWTHWHDRAVLHFLHGADEVRAYAERAACALAPGAHAIIGGFAADGPERCSGLAVARRDPYDVARLLAPAFELLDARREMHRTPLGREQRFAWSVLRRR